MPTTVQVRDQTRRLLERLKREMGLATYDDVIGVLARSKAGTPESIFGACRGSMPFSREAESEHEL